MRSLALHGIRIIFTTLLLGLSSGVAAASPTVLENPSQLSKKAVDSAILAVARAGNRLVAVGERGIVLLSDDNGRSYRQVATPVQVSLTSVTFVGEKKGWAAGHLGVILHTEDSGETWIKQLDGREVAVLASTAAKKRAEVETDQDLRDDILFSAERLVEDGPDKPFLDLYFIDEQNGFAVGAFNLIFRTMDGGKSWVPWQDRVDNPMELHLYGIETAEDTMYIAGEQGLLLSSINGGEQFTFLESPYEGSYFGLVTNPDGSLVVFGLRGNVYRSEDQGESWSQIDVGIPVSLSGGVRLANGELILVSQAGDILESDDGGRTFKRKPNNQPMPITDLVQAGDGSLVVASLRGLWRFPPMNK